MTTHEGAAASARLAPAGPGEWVASRDADIRAVLSDPRFRVPEAGPPGPPGTVSWLRASVSRFANGPEHQRRRGLLVAELRRLGPGALRRAGHDLAVARIAGSGGPGTLVDVMSLLARRVPLAALAASLGIADAQQAAEAVAYLAGEAGIRQFLDIGTGLPTADNTHEVAQRIAPDSRIVYVDNDPIVLAHARALLTSTPQGATAYIQADARDPQAILREAAATLDFRQPVAVMMLALVHFLPGSDYPGQIISAIMDAVVPGSFLTLSSATRDIDTDRMTRATAEFNEQRVAAQFIPRTHAEVSRYFDGLEMVEPGLVPVPKWRGEEMAGEPVLVHGGIGRKP
jgi:hypothetical protein